MSELLSIHDLFADLVIYRDLNAADERLPRYASIRQEIGLDSPVPPRKLETAYAQALAQILRRAQEMRAPAASPSEIVYIGDMPANDGGAFRNIRSLTGWRGWCFIGAEKDESLAVADRDGVYQANRWRALGDFLGGLRAQGAALDRRTVVIVDVDKTILGARGRNDGAIDRARVAAIEATIATALGADFDREQFRAAYATLNASPYHPFTADNQDNLAYICLMLGAGIAALDALAVGVSSGRLRTARDFMAQVEQMRDRLPSDGVRALHDDVYARTLAGDQTPFKAFRRREYQETVDRMGSLPDGAPLARRLTEEICLTREVMEATRWLRARGCLPVALSDKPDEATTPSPELAARGYLPLHRTPAHVIGQSIVDALPA